MIRVYLRYYDEFEGSLLGEFNVEDLPRLVQSVKANNFYYEDAKGSVPDEVNGQYVLDDTFAYYEIVICE